MSQINKRRLVTVSVNPQALHEPGFNKRAMKVGEPPGLTEPDSKRRLVTVV